jgi:hypothetical protein
MIRKLSVAAALALSLGAVLSKPAPAIEFLCSCARCTTSTSNLACRNDHNDGGLRVISCGEYHDRYCV